MKGSDGVAETWVGIRTVYHCGHASEQEYMVGSCGNGRSGHHGEGGAQCSPRGKSGVVGIAVGKDMQRPVWTEVTATEEIETVIEAVALNCTDSVGTRLSRPCRQTVPPLSPIAEVKDEERGSSLGSGH